MLTVELIKNFLIENEINGFSLQPYRWTEDKKSNQKKYIVIQSSGRSIDNQFGVDDVRLIFIAPVGYNRLSFNEEIDKIEKVFLNNHFFENIWFFGLQGSAKYYESKEGRPIFELNIKVNKVT